MIQAFKSVLPSKNKLQIYTDGSHKGKWGSWAFVVVRNDCIIHEASGRQRYTDSHHMEFQAAIQALSYLKNGTYANIYSDSKVLINCATKKRQRTPVNREQVQLLDQLLLKNNISWIWVKAHSGIIYNERCDQLCIKARSIQA